MSQEKRSLSKGLEVKLSSRWERDRQEGRPNFSGSAHTCTTGPVQAHWEPECMSVDLGDAHGCY